MRGCQYASFSGLNSPTARQLVEVTSPRYPLDGESVLVPPPQGQLASAFPMTRLEHSSQPWSMGAKGEPSLRTQPASQAVPWRGLGDCRPPRSLYSLAVHRVQPPASLHRVPAWHWFTSKSSSRRHMFILWLISTATAGSMQGGPRGSAASARTPESPALPPSRWSLLASAPLKPIRPHECKRTTAIIHPTRDADADTGALYTVYPCFAELPPKSRDHLGGTFPTPVGRERPLLPGAQGSDALAGALLTCLSNHSSCSCRTCSTLSLAR